MRLSPGWLLLLVILCIVLLYATANCDGGELRITAYARQGNNVRLQCREYFENGVESIAYNASLFRFNDTSERVVSLLEREGVDYHFNEDGNGVLLFEMHQRLEAYYYCSREESEGLPATYKTLVGKPNCM